MQNHRNRNQSVVVRAGKRRREFIMKGIGRNF